jgi:ABC-type multidrug transport system fused ATPase/permease subunit
MGVVVRDGLRLITRFVRARPISFGFAVAGAVLFAGAIVAAAIVVGTVTDELIVPVLDGGEQLGERWVGAVVAILAVAAWKAAAITLRRTGATWLQYRTQADVRYRLIAHQLSLRLRWFASRSTGDLLAVSETDARQGTFILAPLPFGTGAVLLVVGTVGIVAWIDWVLGLVVLGALAVIVAVDLVGAWRTFEAFHKVQVSRGAVSSVAHESFDGALTVKALGREDYETKRLQSASERLRDDIILVNRVWALFRAIVEAAPSVTTVVLLVVGALRVEAGRLSPGDLVTVAYLLSLLSVPVRLIGFVLWDLAHSLAGWRRVEEVLAADEFVSHGTLEPRVDGSGARVDGSCVSFSYREGEAVLSGLELDVAAGRTVAIVGPTASGKSTLAMLLARLWDPVTGRIRLDGRDLREFAPAALPREVAFVAQEAFLFDDDVTGNITLGLAFMSDEVEAHQRIALARALVRRPRLLVLDDATSAVDPSVETEILVALKRAELPATIVMIAHRRASIVLADEVLFLEGGRIAAHGTHSELLATVPGYARLLEAFEEDASRRRRAALGGESSP